MECGSGYKDKCTKICVSRCNIVNRGYIAAHLRPAHKAMGDTGPIAHVAEALRKSVGPGFELGHWSFFSCCLPLSSVPTEAIRLMSNMYVRMCECMCIALCM